MVSEESDRKKRFCLIPMCAGKRFDLVHKFPMDNARAELWRKLINVPDLNNYTIDEIRKKMFICSKHFAKSDYKHMESRSLNKTALPSKYLGVTEDYENQSNVDEIVQHTIVDNENNTNDNASLFVDSSASVAAAGAVNDEKINESSNKRKYTSPNSYSPNDDLELVEPFEMNINLIKSNKKSKTFVKIIHPPSPIVLPATTVYNEDNDYTDETSEIITTNDDQLILPIHLEELPEDEISIIDGQDESFVDELEDVEPLQTGQLFDNVDEISKEQPQDIVKQTSELITVTVSKDYTTIKTANGSNLHVHHVWLRDFCRCNECWFIKKRINLLNIPINITPIECNIQEKSLFVNWSDGHQSEYSIQQLCHSIKIISSKLTSILWDNLIQNESNLLPFKKVKILDYLSNDEIAKEILFGLIEHGIAFIEQVPTNEQTTEAVVKRLFSIERTHLNRNNDIISFKDNNINSNDYKIPHTDMCYLNAVPGLSIIHHLNDLTKNYSTLFVDGFNIINNIKKNNLNIYERLCHTNVSHQCGNFHHTSPIITLNPLTHEPEQIRFNPYTQSTMNTLLQTELTDFYNDFNCLKNCIEENVWKIELKPGTMVLINNRRILHGYQSLNNNDRSNIIGCYVSHDEFLSVCRKFNIIS